MYAIVRTGGKQYTVSKGDVIKVERLAGDVGSKIERMKPLDMNRISWIEMLDMCKN